MPPDDPPPGIRPRGSAPEDPPDDPLHGSAALG